MQWWNEFVAWLTASETRPVLFSAAVIAVAIIVAALLASGITKAAVRRLVAQRDREMKAAAIAALVDASTEASVWYSLTPGEQVLADRAVGQADIHIRLLPIKGAPLAANWAAHQLAEMKRNSSTFGYELEPVVTEFRDRLVEWQNKPGRAKKIFEADLERWRFENTENERALISEQDKWSAKRHRDEHTDDTSATKASTKSSSTADDVVYRDDERVVAVPAAASTAAVSAPESDNDSTNTHASTSPAGDTSTHRETTDSSATPASTAADTTATESSASATPASATALPATPAATDLQTQKLMDDVAALDAQLAAVRKDDEHDGQVGDAGQRTA
ncbi:hypothetical protein ACUWEX_06715 [Okibacterium fritillariae]|uniref:hypothetical protein n=1 Tax=Okibacterium fritillariae TaxID=123320 RepID=UPI00405548D3